MNISSIYRILITSPSIDPKYNVSGIANLTRMLIEHNEKVKYKLFIAGKKDYEEKGYKWLLKQFIVLLAFKKQIKNEFIKLVHINMPLVKAAIVRDTSFATVCRLLNKPYILHLRGGIYSKNIQTPFFLKFIIKKSLNQSRKIIVLGNSEKKFIHEYYKIDKEKIIVLPNCVKIHDYKQKKFDIYNKINILYLGRIDKKKGLKEIIQALSSLSSNINYSFSIAGNGSDKDWFINNCKKELNHKFTNNGIVYGELKNQLLLNSHIFLLPSYYEGLPNALLEAMSYGVVPIVTPVGSIPEVIRNKDNGLMVSIKNSHEIKKAIEFLVNNEKFFIQLSQNAYKTIADNYSLNNYIKSLNEIYFSI